MVFLLEFWSFFKKEEEKEEDPIWSGCSYGKCSWWRPTRGYWRWETRGWRGRSWSCKCTLKIEKTRKFDWIFFHEKGFGGKKKKSKKKPVLDEDEHGEAEEGGEGKRIFN